MSSPPSGAEGPAPEGPSQASLRAAARVVVSDAGPLISLGRLDLIGVLGALLTEVLVPEAVVRECLARPGNVDALRIGQALNQGLLRSCHTPPHDLPGLGPGESAAILHALAIDAMVLMDERAGRARAQELGLRVTGTLGVLVRARQLQIVGPLTPIVAALRASGQRLDDALVRHALAAVGEPDA